MDQLKTLPMILADQTFFGHQDLDWFGEGGPSRGGHLQPHLQRHLPGGARHRLCPVLWTGW